MAESDNRCRASDVRRGATKVFGACFGQSRTPDPTKQATDHRYQIADDMSNIYL